jgi:aminocarboxymuconate-semialdehyde decarboxylase
MEALDRPIWVHPARGPQFADYATEERSMYGLHAALGWPFDTAVFVARLVFGGVLDRHPRIKIVTHHGGGMIPHFAQRLGRRVGRLPDQWPSDPEEITARATELCRRLYADTALNGSIHAVRCSLAFFGADHLLFGTDMPFDDENGRACVRDTIANIAELQVSESDRRSMLSGTAERLLGLAKRPSVATARQ